MNQMTRVSDSIRLGQLGVWMALEDLSAQGTAQLVKRVEELGYAALWCPEAVGRNVLVHAAWLLANCTKLVVASGIANIYARDPMAMTSAQLGLNEQSGDRFLLGIGVSHTKFVRELRGHEYGRPVETMRNYLGAMQETVYKAPLPALRPTTVIAALRQKMMILAREHAHGAHTLNVTPDHTARARAILGPDRLLCVEQKVILEANPTAARAIGRAALAGYMSLPNYLTLWKELGFDDTDFVGNGSDRLVDALVGWGDETAVRRRIQDHFDAGASHVCFNPVGRGDGGRDMRLLELLAPAQYL